MMEVNSDHQFNHYSVTANLSSGDITVATEETEIAQNICLAVSVTHVLCDRVLIKVKDPVPFGGWWKWFGGNDENGGSGGGSSGGSGGSGGSDGGRDGCCDCGGCD